MERQSIEQNTSPEQLAQLVESMGVMVADALISEVIA